MHVSLSGTLAANGTAPATPAPAAAKSFGAVLDARLGASAPPPAADPPSARGALESLERARSELDAAVAAARTGRTFSPAELLALQSQAYRYGSSLELASKIVEQAAQAVKQAVNTQV